MAIHYLLLSEYLTSTDKFAYKFPLRIGQSSILGLLGFFFRHLGEMAESMSILQNENCDQRILGKRKADGKRQSLEDAVAFFTKGNHSCYSLC